MIQANPYSRFCLLLLATCLIASNYCNIVSAHEPARTSAKSKSKSEIQKISDQIDELVEQKLQQSGQSINELSSDEVFLRRAYLDIAGRIPTVKETKEFLRSSSSQKRSDLIDELLDSYGYVSRQFNFWADILRVKTRMPGNLSGVSYIDYLKDSLQENKPYDEFVRELITSDGANMKRGNGAVGYYLRDRNMPEDNMSNTVRIFLGTRLECAQCHDHPFDKWTQRQYFEMVAFTGGLRYRNEDTPKAIDDVRRMVRKGEIPRTAQGVVNRLSQQVTYGISGGGTGLARLPEGFLGEDGKEGEIVVGKTMFEGKKLVDSKVPRNTKTKFKRRGNAQQGFIPGSKDLQSREAYAQWMTDPGNPRFAKVIANRMWKQALGLGLIEPIDIIEDGTEASNPELMDFLTETMIELDFDVKQFLRAIYNSKVYQATSYDKDIPDPAEYGFNGPVMRRLSAEQLWDSLLVLTVDEFDQRKSTPTAYNRYGMSGDPYENYEQLVNMSVNELKNLITELSDKSMNKRKRQVDPKVAAERKRLQAKRKQLQSQLKQAQKRRNTPQIRKLRIEIAKTEAEYKKTLGNGRSLLRASELESPARPGHFLREFGQSDRDTIENSNTDPAVTQVLSMMNGYVEQKITRDSSSVLMQTALTARSGKECTDLIFLSMLNRKPTAAEAKEWKYEFESAVKQKDPAKIKEIYSDLIWMLANSNEFIFNK
ncbi:MAG: DUF1549 domain-containing protein [Planctomycetota bacterium]